MMPDRRALIGILEWDLDLFDGPGGLWFPLLLLCRLALHVPQLTGDDLQSVMAFFRR